MNDVLNKNNFKGDLYTFGKICRELRSSIVHGTALDSATLRLSDICEIYSVDEVMARAVTETLVSEQYISHRHGNRRYTIEYNVEELKFLSKCRLFHEKNALKICLFQQNRSICDQQLRYKELLHDYQNNIDMSSANFAYGCALFRQLNQTEFDRIKFYLCGHSKYLRLYWEEPRNLSIYLCGLKSFNDSCIELDSASASKHLEDIIGKVERYVEDVLDSREISALRSYDQPTIADASAGSRRVTRRKNA